MNFKTGDKVRVRSWEEIKQTLSRGRTYKGYAFPEAMEIYCGEIITLGRRVTNYCFRDSNERWSWCDAWLEPIGNFDKKEKEPMKMEKVVVVRGMNEGQVRKYLGYLAKRIETIEMSRSVWEICEDIFNKRRNEETSYFLKGNTTVAVTKDGRVGVARLRAGDTYNINVGRALARSRALRFKALEKELLAAL